MGIFYPPENPNEFDIIAPLTIEELRAGMRYYGNATLWKALDDAPRQLPLGRAGGIWSELRYNLYLTPLLLAVGAALGVGVRWIRGRTERAGKPLPWGMYLALWAFGTWATVSWLPLWYVPRVETPGGYREGASFWFVLDFLHLFWPGWGYEYVQKELWVNVLRTIIGLTAGAALGAGVRWVRRDRIARLP